MITTRGLAQLLGVVLAVGLICFVLGTFLQLGLNALQPALSAAPQPTVPPMPTAAPSSTSLPSPTPLPSPTALATATPPPAPTATREPRPTRTRNPDASPTPATFIYTIEDGDTLSAIADRFNLPAREILSANPGLNPNLIVSGGTLIIPIPPPDVTPTP